MKYGITSEHGQVCIECLNGRVGSFGQRLVAKCSDSVVQLADRLAARGHIAFEIVYKGRRVSEQTYKHLQMEDDYDKSAVSILAESRWDVLSLVGFAKVLIERPGIVVHRRAA